MGIGRSVAGVVAVLALLGAACSDGDAGDPGEPSSEDGSGAAPGASEGLVVSSVSTAPERVTGGDVLVQIDGAPDASSIEVTVDGDPAEADVHERTGDGPLRVLVAGLPDGEATIEVTAGDASATLEVTNHPVTGPVFSGPHIEPLVCLTEENGLGPATDEDCSAPTEVRWSYVTDAGEVVSLDDPSVVPADAAITTIGGEEVPLVVRSESGTINRGVYWIHVLDPSPVAERWDPGAWSGSLVYRFGGGCGTSYSQGSVLGDAGSVAGAGFDVDLLRAGHAMATNTFNTFQVMCNDVLSAESLMMTKERFIEGFGVPDHTIGEGGSGGAIQQYLIAQNYPGLLDALVASVPFPDGLSIAPGIVDCGLLEAHWASGASGEWTDEQRAAVTGFASPDTCAEWVGSFLSVIDPTVGCALDPDLVYDPDANPDGARCTLTDSNVNVLGIDDDTGFARRPLDNVGVQYGLRALEDGVISVEQFLDLNETVGGYDADGRIVPERMVGNEDDLRVVYETGFINQGGGDLRQVPIYTLDVYTDTIGDIHDRMRAFSLVERLRDGDGEPAPNLVLWTVPGEGDLLASLLGTSGQSTRLEMIGHAIEWLDALDAPAGERTAADLEAARPDDGGDLCITLDGERYRGDDLYDEGHPCAEAYPIAAEPRMAAGAPLDSLAARCELTDVDPSAYGVELTADQEERLATIFPDGVCDWDRPGVGQADLLGPWLDFSDGPLR